MATIPMEDLLRFTVEEGASDLHITVGAPPTVRLKGSLTKLNVAPLTPEDTEMLVRSITGDAQFERVNTEVSVDVPSFAEGLRRALRQDPDVILLGEMRDLETIETAITAAETGHLVFSTLHTTGASRTIDRIIDVFGAERQEQIRVQMSANLKAVISQALLPRRDGTGRVAASELMVNTPSIAALIRDNKSYRVHNETWTGA